MLCGQSIHDCIDMANNINVNSNEYFYYPFDYSGHIYTIDIDLWRATHVAPSVESYPDDYSIRRALSNPNMDCLVGVVDRLHWVPPGWGEVNPITLTTVDILSEYNVVFLGLDVIDDSGVSGLVNLGLTQSEVGKLTARDWRINNYGLIDNFHDATKYSGLLNDLAAEHSSFFPVFVYGRPASLGWVERTKCKGGPNET